MTRWTLAEGAALICDREADFRRSGWLLGLYGSVLSGEGRDLDLMAVAWRPDAAPPEWMADSLGSRIKGEPDETGLRGCRSCLRIRDDRIIDIVFEAPAKKFE